MSIRYIAYNESGEKIAGIIATDSESAAEKTLWESNLTIVSMQSVRPRASRYEMFPSLFKVKARDLISFARELAFLLESGITLLPSLKLLLARTPNARLKDTIIRIIQELESGNTFSSCLSKYPGVFPPIFSKLVMVGEETGGLAVMLHKVESYLDRQEKLSHKVKKALTYPSIVFVFGILGAVTLLVFVLPKLATLFDEFGAGMPASARILIATNGWLQNNGLYLLFIIAALILGGWRYFSTAEGRKKWDYLALRLPTVGKVLLSSSQATFASAMSVLLSAGLPFMETINMVRTISTNRVFQDATTVIQADVFMGLSLSEALAKHHIFSHIMVQMVSIAEHSGDLPRSMERQFQLFEEETDRAISSMTALIEPIAIVIVGLLVGFVATTMFSSIYSLVGQVG